jgi:hypothetical protein
VVWLGPGWKVNQSRRNSPPKNIASSAEDNCHISKLKTPFCFVAKIIIPKRNVTLNRSYTKI